MIFDYIIVGAGPAGCVLAHRLSSLPNLQVLLLEAGPEDNHPLIHMPKGIGKILGDSRYTWAHAAKEGSPSAERDAVWLRGKTLGGSSSVNGLIYVRGQPADYEDLAALTSDDWGWSHMQRCFKAIEDHELGAADSRGVGGPLRITVPTDRDPLSEAALASGRQLGLDCQEDVNAPDDACKIGYAARTIHRGRRQSAAVAFLKPIQGRRNLKVQTGFLLDTVDFAGTKALGVTGVFQGNKQSYRGNKVILCAGTLSSPAILQRSGVGPRSLLDGLQVPIVHESAEVGANLQEHWSLIMQWRLKSPVSQNQEFRGWRLVMNTLKYYALRRGPMANATFEVVAWLKSQPALKRPDMQFLIAPYTIDFAAQSMAVEAMPGMQIGAYPLRPESKGSLAITSRSPAAAPHIELNFFAAPKDRQVMLAIVRLARQLCACGPLGQLIERETRPGAETLEEQDVLAAYGQHGTIAYHAVGTCRMGHDPQSVTDPTTRVRGVENLHVVDLSILPFIVAGNTYGPLCAIAWRAAELLEPRLAPRR